MYNSIMSQIVLYPSQILRERSVEVEKVDDHLISDIREVEEVLKKTDNGAGLSAIQIGIKKRFFVTGKKGVVVINPKIIGKKGDKTYLKTKGDDLREDDFLEGCLSVPDFFGMVKRWLEIEAEWQVIKNGKLERKREKLKNFEAVVFQHELDHLNGILFIDHIKKEGGKFYKWLAGQMIEWKLEEV